MSGIAVGKPVELGNKLNKMNTREYIEKLMNGGFTGYTCFMISGKTGIEEGLLFFSKGKIRIANYTYFHYNTTFTKKEGQKRCVNALAAENGILDTFSVTDEQDKLIKTLKEDEVFTEDIKVSIPQKFSYDFEDELINKFMKEKKTSREDILRRYGITSLRSTEASKEELLLRSKQETDDIHKLVNK